MEFTNSRKMSSEELRNNEAYVLARKYFNSYITHSNKMDEDYPLPNPYAISAQAAEAVLWKVDDNQDKIWKLERELKDLKKELSIYKKVLKIEDKDEEENLE